MKRPLYRYGWERRYLRKCNFLDRVGRGKGKGWHPLLNHFEQLFALLGGINTRLILLYENVIFLTGWGGVGGEKEKVGTLS